MRWYKTNGKKKCRIQNMVRWRAEKEKSERMKFRRWKERQNTRRKKMQDVKRKMKVESSNEGKRKNSKNKDRARSLEVREY